MPTKRLSRDLPAKIYHYTTIDKLALILKHKTLRFKNLKYVDDQDEGITQDQGSFKDFVFVSSWTAVAEENIALWHMYAGNMNGVRIGLDPAAIKFLPVETTPEAARAYIVENCVSQTGDVIPIKWFENVVPVKYSDRMYAFSGRRSKNVTPLNVHNIYTYKKKVWSFQHETRLVMLGVSKAQMQKHSRMLHRVDSALISIIKQESFDCEYLDLSMDDATIASLEIVLGPNYAGTSADEILVRALLEEHAKGHGIPVSKSQLNILRK